LQRTMTAAAWTALADALGTVALVVAALAYLAWDRWLDVIEDQHQEKGHFDDWD
jgi:Co/Zn/Cd efflux system component